MKKACTQLKYYIIKAYIVLAYSVCFLDGWCESLSWLLYCTLGSGQEDGRGR